MTGSDPGIGNVVDVLRDSVTPVQRLALSYAPRHARLPWLALLALDARLAGIVRNSREPMLAQLRLAWWREHLAADAATWPTGEPLLTALRSWGGSHSKLTELTVGWEAMTGAAPLPAADFAAFAAARGSALAALGQVLGCRTEAERAARAGEAWALADIAGKVAHPAERLEAGRLALAADWKRPRLSRGLRPLVVLHGLAKRDVLTSTSGERPATRLLAALRLGLFGR